MKIVLKETRVCIKIIRRKEMIKPVSRLDAVMKENEEIIAIISKSIDTAKKNNRKDKKEKSE